jgi:transcriptional regulator with XRE-family HTH domain
LRRLDVLGLRVLKAVIRVRAIVARVATRVREERVRKHLTFDDLAFTARVARSSIIRFETGKSGIQLETLARLVVRGLELGNHGKRPEDESRLLEGAGLEPGSSPLAR